MPTEVIVASTTDTMEDVNVAAGLPPEGDELDEGVKPAESEAEPEVGEAEAEAESEPAEGEGEEQPAKPTAKPPRWQKRVDRLTARNYELTEQLETSRKSYDDLSRRLSALERGEKVTATQEPTQPAVTARPKSTDFQTYDDFIEALTDWKVAQERQKMEVEAQAVQQRDVQARQTQIFADYNRGVEDARAEFEDFAEVVGQDIEIPKGVEIAIIEMGREGGRVAYALASDAEFCDQLSNIEQTRGSANAIAAFGRWLERNAPTAQETRASAEPQRPVAVRRPARTPRPISPVGGAPTRGRVDLDTADYQTYKTVRAQQIRERSGR